MIRILFIFLYILFAILYVYSGYKGKKIMEYYSKPFLMPLLALIYVLFVFSINKYFIIAVLLGFLGDFLLMFKGSKFFISGLFSFLLGHIFYSIVFISSITNIGDLSLSFYLVLAPYLIYGISIYLALHKYLGNMKIAVIVYIIGIIGTSFTTLMYAWSNETFIYWLPFVGSLFFILSDSILSIKVFRKEIKKGDFWVGITYIIAQTLIVIGVILVHSS